LWNLQNWGERDRWVVGLLGFWCVAVMAAANEWIYGYLEAILDTGERINDSRRQADTNAAGDDKESFKAAKYFVDEVTGFDESSLYRTWIKVACFPCLPLLLFVCSFALAFFFLLFLCFSIPLFSSESASTKTNLVLQEFLFSEAQIDCVHRLIFVVVVVVVVVVAVVVLHLEQYGWRVL
jgi:hypothetical protein